MGRPNRFVKFETDEFRTLDSEFDNSILAALLTAAKKRGKIEVKVFADDEAEVPEREITFFSESRLNVDQQLREIFEDTE